MTMRTSIKTLASTLAVVLATVGLANPSYADTTVSLSGTLTLDTGDPDDPFDSRYVGGVVAPDAISAQTVTISITASWADGSEDVPVWIQAGGLLAKADGTSCEDFGECAVVAGGTPVTFNIDPSADDSVVSFYEVEGWPIVGSFTVTYAIPTVTSGGLGPAPHIQQFPMPAVGTCDEAEPEGVNWSGVASGGWGESWAQWMNDGEGGFVCTRTLIYNQSRAAWEVD